MPLGEANLSSVSSRVLMRPPHQVDRPGRRQGRIMRMYAFCARCGTAISGANGLCPPCLRLQQLMGAKRIRDEKRSNRGH
jgi:hypothetical protein